MCIGRGTFFLDNGHSFDNVLFYGNEMLLFMLELLLFICIIVICGNFLFAILFVGIVYEVRLSNDDNRNQQINASVSIFPFSDSETHRSSYGKEEFVQANTDRWTISNVILYLKWTI